MKKVIAFGTFDILHPGHTYFLSEAKKLGDYLTVVVARDATVKIVKKRAPVHAEDERRRALENLGVADKVILGNLNNKYEVIASEAPEVIALGYDQEAFVGELSEHVPASVQIVRLQSLEPEKYKSSKFRYD